MSDVYGTPAASRSATPGSAPSSACATWVDLLALRAAEPRPGWTGHAVGRARGRPRSGRSPGPLDHRALDWLRDLVELRDLGLCRPLPAPVATAGAWAEARARELRGYDARPTDAGAREWETDADNRYGIRGEDADASHRAGATASARRVRLLLDAGLASARLADLGAAAVRGREGGAAVSR